MNDDAAHWDAVEEATELLREGDHDGALASLRAAVERDPKNAYAHFFTGAALFEKADFGEALEAYQRALAHAPRYLGAVVGAGHALRMLGRNAEAIRMGQHALALAGEAKGDGDAHFLLGLTHAAQGDVARAIAHLEAFLASDPELEARYEAEAVLETLRGKARRLEPIE